MEQFDDANIHIAQILDKVEAAGKSYLRCQRARFTMSSVEVEHQLEKLATVAGASLVVSKNNPRRCLHKTRENILAEISGWANASAGDHSQHIFLLTGVAGSGKSAIAHTVASQFKGEDKEDEEDEEDDEDEDEETDHAAADESVKEKDKDKDEVAAGEEQSRVSGRLGASFAFDRQDPTRRSHHLFPHVARLLSDHGEAMKKALAKIIASDAELARTEDIRTQFQRFIAKPLKGLTIVQPILIVIDAVDEILDGSPATAGALDTLLSTLKEGMTRLPPNIRFLITSRPEPRVMRIFENNPGVLIRDISDDPSTEADILSYSRMRLHELKDRPSAHIDDSCCQTIARMSQGLFQWASVVCNEMTDEKCLSPFTTYELLTAGTAGNAGLLDGLYTTVLSNNFAVDSTDTMNQFATVMSFILALREPLPTTAVRELWQAWGGADAEVLEAVLKRVRSLLVGYKDEQRPLQPSHTSFVDFLVDPSRSGRFAVSVTGAHSLLAVASLNIMRDQLKFNICEIESSYMLNKEVLDLGSRIHKNIRHECSYACQFWAAHLDAVRNTAMLYREPKFRSALATFLTKKLLAWLEVLSVLGKVSVGSAAMSKLVSFLSVR